MSIRNHGGRKGDDWSTNYADEIALGSKRHDRMLDQARSFPVQRGFKPLPSERYRKSAKQP